MKKSYIKKNKWIKQIGQWDSIIQIENLKKFNNNLNLIRNSKRDYCRSSSSNRRSNSRNNKIFNNNSKCSKVAKITKIQKLLMYQYNKVQY